MRHGPTGADEAYLPVRTIATWTCRFLCNLKNSRCRRDQEDDYHHAIDEGLNCLVRDVTRKVVVNSSGSMGSVRVNTHDPCRWAVSVLILCCRREGECSRYHKISISDVTRVAMVLYHNRCAPRAMVSNVASCMIVNTFLVAEQINSKVTRERDLSQVNFINRGFESAAKMLVK